MENQSLVLGVLNSSLRRSIEGDCITTVAALLGNCYNEYGIILQSAGILKRLGRLFHVAKTSSGISRQKVEAGIESEFADNKITETILHKPRIRQKFDTLLNFNYQLGGETALQTLRFDEKFHLTDYAIYDIINLRVEMLYRNLFKELHSEIRRVLAAKLMIGESSEYALMASLKSVAILTRVRRVVQTESNALFNTAVFDCYWRSNVEYKNWQTYDELSRPIHRANQNVGELPITNSFPSGDFYPGDRVSLHNCRCFLYTNLQNQIKQLEPWTGKPGAYLNFSDYSVGLEVN